MPWPFLDGLKIEGSGPEAAHASRSHAPARDSGRKTKDTSGQSFEGSSKSASLQKLLGNKLRRRLAVYGSREYELTWKNWDMSSGPPICALRASAPHTSDKGSTGSQEETGWPTPNTMGGGQTSRGGDRKDELMGGLVKPSGWPTPAAHEFEQDMDRVWERRKEQKALGRNGNGFGLTLGMAIHLAGWPTASARDWKDTPGMATTGTNPDGSERKRLDQLPRVASLAGWPTPIVNDELGSTHCYGKKDKNGDRKRFLKLPGAAKTAGWPTPNVPNGGRTTNVGGYTEDGRKIQADLGAVAKTAGWPTPKAQEDGRSLEQWQEFHDKNPRANSSGGPPGLNLQVAAQLAASPTGTPQDGTNAKTKGKEGYRLNPKFSLWLLGYPAVEWASSGELAMRSLRRSRQNS